MKFYKKGKLIAEAADWYWFNLGFITSYKENVVAVASNFRGGFNE